MKSKYLISSIVLLLVGLYLYYGNIFHNESSSVPTSTVVKSTQESNGKSEIAQPSGAEAEESEDVAEKQSRQHANARSGTSTPPQTSGLSSSSTNEPVWFNAVDDKDKLKPDPVLTRHEELKGIGNADLSEMSTRGQYVEKIFEMFDDPLGKHERRARNRLSELLEEAAGEQTRARAEVLGLEYDGIDAQGRGFVIVGFDQGKPHYIYTQNASAADSSGASYVRQNTDFDPVFGPDIDGSGFFFNINDHGIARQHLEFQLPNGGGSRVIEREVPDRDGHMDHVTGTVGAHGYREDAKGMAPAVMMYSLNQQSNADVSLLGAQYPFQPRRSIGGTTSLGGGYTGLYTFSGRTFDEVLREAPYYLHFYAVGNEGGWNEISSGRQVAKNVVSVGSGRHVNRDANGNFISGGNLSGFSSEGPADDGRIKPDILANGEGVLSTSGTTRYSSKQGTSMATPNASGSSILLQDYFSKRFPGHLMQSMSLKNLILHTADDLGNTGPDYKHGWGFMNTRKAADIIKAYADNPGNQRMIEGVLRNGDSHTYTFTWDGSSPLVANLAWLDHEGYASWTDDDRTPNLKYDLDLRVQSPSGSTTYLPWAMPFVLNGFDTNDYNDPAVKADNTTDNVEQVRIGSPTETGVYTITVSHKGTIDSGADVRYSLIVSGVENVASASAPTISSFTPTEGTHHHSLVTVFGTGFLLGADVSLQAPGLETVEGYAEKVTPEEIEVFLPLDRVPAGDYKLVVLNPDGQSVTSSGDFTVTAYTDLLNEDFDAAGIPAGWLTGATTGANDWTISTSVAVSGNSVHVPTRTEEVESYLESPAIVIPDTNDPIKLSFEHQWDFEIELPTSSFGAHEGEDGAILRVSVDGGPFEDVDQDYWDNGHAPGTEIVSGDYWDNIDSNSPLRYPSATTYAWTDESGGWQRTTVLLDSTTYKNKTLRFRWVLGTQNTGSDNDEGWWIDNVSLSVKADNALPQASTEPATEATVGQAYSSSIAFTDADGNPLTLTAASKPAWLAFTDNGDGSATLSGTPSASASETVVIEADDGTETRSYTFTLVVLPPGGNTPPTFTTATLEPAIIEQPYTFDLVTADADGHALSLSVEGLPSWLSFTDNGDGTGSFSGTPNSYAMGAVDLTIHSSDSIDTATQVFALQILPPSQIAFSTGIASVGEGDGSLSLTVTRSLNSLGEVSVDYTTVAGTASADADYTTTSGTLTWPDGDSAPQTVTVDILDDTEYNEGNETFTVSLSGPTNGGVLGEADVTTVTITENDINEAPVISMDNPLSAVVSVQSGQGLVIDTTVTDDGILNPFTLTWSQIDGPGTASFSAPSAEDTGVTFSADGSYVLRLTADDGLNQTVLDIQVGVGVSAGILVPQDGLVAHLPFDENMGTTAADSMTEDGESNDGTLTNGATWAAAGQDGAAVSLDGVDDVVTMENSTQINDGTFPKRTIGLWFKGADVTTRQLLFEEGGNTRGFSIYLDQGNVYVGGWNNGENGWTETYLSSPVSADTWHHVALVLDATDGGSSLETNVFHLYLDGALISSGDGAPINVHTGGIGIGGINISANFHDAQEASGFEFAGTIDDLVLYNAALSGSQIAGLTGGGNLSPEVDPGGPYAVSAGSPLSLAATVTDDGNPADPGAVSLSWSHVSGTGTASFVDSTLEDAVVSFDAAGIYTLRLTATDGEVTTFAEVDVTVNPASPSVLLTESDGTTDIAEGGATDSYSLVLGEQPSADVTVTISPDSQVDTDVSSVVFTSVNWNSPQTVTVSAVDDAANEGTHSGSISHSVSSADGDYNGIAVDGVTAAITDDDLPGTLQLTSSTVNVDESAGTVTLSVSRTGGDAGAVSVDYATSDGTATAGSDFTAATGTLNWADGDSADKDIVISITDDGGTESTETFTVNLSNAVSATLGATDSATVSIIDDEFSPASVPGLVGWYDAQSLSGSDGTQVTTWADTTGGTNNVADNLTQVTSVTGTPVAPTLETVTLNGYSFRSVRTNILSGDQYELLENSALVSSGDTSRTVIVVYKGGVDHANSRPVGFGSTMKDGSLSGNKVTWNLGCDGTGSSRFDSAKIAADNPDSGDTYAAGLTRTDFLIRSAVMEADNQFSEYIDVLDGNFTDNQVLLSEDANTALSTIRGDFFIGDVQGTNKGGGNGDSDFDILEVLVFDTALTDTQRQNVQSWLQTKYTTDPNPAATIEVVRDSDSAVMSTHASVSDAIANLPGGTGYTIVMPAGTFTESGALMLPEGIGLRGAGVDATTLVSTYASSVTGAFPPDKFAIQLDSASQTAGNQILEDFTLDGSSWAVQGGIYVDNRTGVTLRDLRVRDFSWSGIWVERVQSVNLTNVEVLESSWSDINYASGSIGIGDADTVTLDQVTITSTNSGGGSRGVGYGIKATHSNSTGRFWETVVIQNSTIDVVPNSLWDGGQAPNISIEAHNLEIRNSRITNNTLYNNMSIVGTASGATPSMRIDNNHVVLKDASASNGNYGVEMSTPNMEIDHNYFGGNMVRAFADWTANRPLTGISIHHNIFQGNTGDTLVWLKSEAPGLLFANNVVGETSSTGGHRVFYFDAGDSAGLQIANNLFHYPPGSSDEALIVLNSGASASSLTVRNNWFQRISTGTPAGTWTDNQTGSAPILGTGDFWGSYYQPQPSSALVDAGADVGLSFQGAAPEIGRWEVDAPTAPSGLGATVASSTQIDLTWTDNSGNETGFKVQRSTTSGSGFTTITTTAADAVSYSDTGLTAGTTYYYRIIATNGIEDSDPTSEATATTPKIMPVITTTPTALAIGYGQTLADATLSGGVASVSGSFAFTTPATVPSVGTANFEVTFTPTNTLSYETVTLQVSVTVKANFASWVLDNSLSGADADTNADPDGDGLPNLVEYALSGDPNTSEPSGLATVSVSEGKLRLDFSRLNDAAVDIAVEASVDLSSWATLATYTASSGSWSEIGGLVSEVPSASTSAVTVIQNDSLSTAGGRQFMRLKVTDAP